MQATAELLQRHFPALGENLAAHDFEQLAAALVPRKVGAGQLVLEEGKPEGTLHLLVEGTLVVTVAEGGAPIEVGRLAPGALFGEVSLMDEGPASSTVRADGEAGLLSLGRSELLTLHAKAPRAATAVLRAISLTLAERVRTSTDRLEALSGNATKAETSTGLLGALRSLFGGRD